jgi:uncharacterized membrane protein
MEDKNEQPQNESAVPVEEVDFTEKEEEKDIIAAVLAYVPFLCFYGLLFRRENAFAFHHAKQGLAIFIAEVLAVALRWDLIWNIALILIGGVAIWAMISAWRGESFRIPIISDLLDQY